MPAARSDGQPRQVPMRPRAGTPRRRAADLLALAWLAGLAACGASGPAEVAPAPSISSFAAARSPLTAGEATTLTAVFAGGTGRVDPGVGPIESGVPAGTGALAEDTTFTLSVGGEGGTAERTVRVVVVAAPVVPVVTAPALLTAGAAGAASVPPQDGVTFEWTITGGTFPGGRSATTGASTTFTAGGPGVLHLACTATNSAGATSAPGARDVTLVAPRPSPPSRRRARRSPRAAPPPSPPPSAAARAPWTTAWAP